MKLREALELAEECGLMTVGEAILNAEIHSPSLFPYDRISAELKELCDEAKNIDDSELIHNILGRNT